MNGTTVIIQCEPNQEWEPLLEQERGQTLLTFLVARLRQIHGADRIYLLLEDADHRKALYVLQDRGSVRPDEQKDLRH